MYEGRAPRLVLLYLPSRFGTRLSVSFNRGDGGTKLSRRDEGGEIGGRCFDCSRSGAPKMGSEILCFVFLNPLEHCLRKRWLSK